MPIRLSVTTSVYKIEQINSLYDAATPEHPLGKAQIGKEVSKGYELEVVGLQVAENAPVDSIELCASHPISSVGRALCQNHAMRAIKLRDRGNPL